MEKIDNPFRYCGEYLDEETGNYYLRARYYDPSIQRFTQEDLYSIAYGAAWREHPYGYSANNPIKFIDPTGHLIVNVDGIDVSSAAWVLKRKSYAMLFELEASIHAIVGKNGEITYNGITYKYKLGQMTVALTDFAKNHYLRIEYDPKLNTTFLTSKKIYVTKAQLDELFDRFGHFQAGKVTNEMVMKLNDTIEKYIVDGCTDNNKIKKRIKHYLTQCLAESRNGLTEKYNGDPNEYFKKRVEGGAKYRGAGYIQLTHKSNYQAFADATGDQKIVDEGYDYVAKNYAWEAAGFWWNDNGMNELVDNGNSLKQISNAVNRGPNNKNSKQNPYGWENRQNAWELVNEVII